MKLKGWAMKFKIRNLLGYIAIFIGLSASMANAQILDRYVRFTVNNGNLTQLQSGGLDIIELSTGFSDTFKPAQLVGVDILNVHVEFFDPEGKQVYIVLRDLGGGYLNAKGWQQFQAALALDVGTVSGTYVNGWVIKESLPYRPGNTACCTRSVTSQSVIESTAFGFEVTDSTIAIKSMRVQFNFNNPSDPVVITDDGGFNRLSLSMRSEDIALVAVPILGRLRGPFDDDGIAIDVDGDGVIDSGFGDRKIGIGLGQAQHFWYEFFGYPAIPNSDDFAYAALLPDGFALDPVGEENFNACIDGSCDGIVLSPAASCNLTISGATQKKKNAAVLKNAVVEPLNPFTNGSACAPKIFIVTQAEGKGKNSVFTPTECQTAEISGALTIDLHVKLANGVQIFDKVTDTLLPENNAVQLEPIGCD
jgi:hypothetical protein